MSRSSGAVTIGSGILASRLLGLVRDRVLAHFFGTGPLLDVFVVALRGPNILQNLLGEQALSAAFIPVYSRQLAAGKEEEAGRFAGAVFGLLLAVTALVSLAGLLLARPLVALLVPGFLADAHLVAAGEAAVDRFELAVTAVRIMIPMAASTVLAAFCLGVLNSHRRFFLPYFAPVLWNAAIITALLGAASSLGGGRGGRDLLVAGCVGALVGGLLQFLVQLPLVVRLNGGLPVSLSTRVAGVREALRNFGPALAGRGVVQLSSWLDQVLASLLVVGAPGGLGLAQRLYTLPVSLLGISIAAAELPELSRATAVPATPERLQEIRRRLDDAWAQMSFLTMPSALGYLALGYFVVGALYRTGAFSRGSNWLVYLILGGYSLGLLASTGSRLLQNTFFAFGDTRSPARVAGVRLLASAAAGVALMFWLDRFTVGDLVPLEAGEPDPHLGAVGLALAGGVAAWLELVLLARRLRPRLELGLPWGAWGRMAALCAVCLLPGGAVVWMLRERHPLPVALLAVGLFGGAYLGAARALGWPEAVRFWSQVRERLPRMGGRAAPGE